MTVLQLTGTLLGIPVGLASAYSIYRANFSVETTCQILRGNIISMIDKKIDASARRMLVRHDVETFEKTCGGVDPDAEAAFKTLLAADKAPAKAAAAVVPRTEAQPKAAANANADKIELRPSLPAKRPATATAAPTAAPPAQRDTAASDARWLEAVRGALVTHVPERAATGAPPAPLRLAPPETNLASQAPAMPPVQPAPTAPIAAPALPPPTPVAVVPSQPSDVDHPVPPAPIPDAAPSAGEQSTSWVAKIPFVGQTLAR